MSYTAKPLIELFYQEKKPNHINRIHRMLYLDETDTRRFIHEKIRPKSQMFSTIYYLDLHNVVDSLTEQELDKLAYIDGLKIIVSFVGWKGQTRHTAQDQIVEYLKKEIIDFGILVFVRGKRRKPTTALGSKYWIIRLMQDCLHPKKAFFLDDSYDHVESVWYISSVKSKQYLRRSMDFFQELEIE